MGDVQRGVSGFFRSLSFAGTPPNPSTGDTTIDMNASAGSLSRNQSGDKLDSQGQEKNPKVNALDIVTTQR